MEDHTVSQKVTAGSEPVQVTESVEVVVTAEAEEKLKSSGGDDGGGDDGFEEVADIPPGFESGGDGNYGVVAAVAPSSGEGEGEGESFRVKRKRGRPKKQLAGAVEAPRKEFMVVPGNSAPPQKRGRGRPRGTGKWQTLAASLGGTIRETAGTDFTPYIIPIQEGENIVQRIWSFSQRISESICILSAAGTISSAEVHNPDSPGSVIRYEGQFSIVYLGGSHTYDDKGSGKICLLSVQLVNAEGRFCGGAVASSLIASGPTQLIIATFRQKVIRPQPKVTPPRIETPKPNKGSDRVLVTAVNSESANAEAKGVATGSPPPKEVAETEPNVGRAASSSPPPMPVDWKSFEQSIASGSGCATSSSGLDTGVIN